MTFLLTIIFFSGCNDNHILNPVKPEIKNLSKQNTYSGDIITIYGSNFGFKSDSSFIMIDTNDVLSSRNSIKWNQTMIKFKIPKYAISGKLKIRIGSDTSNFIEIKIDRLPPFDEIKISSGKFLMGSNTGLYDETPVRELNLNKNFFISKLEISQELYFIVTDTNPSVFKSHDLPVHNINWLDAIKFCNKLSKLKGLDTAYIFIKDSVIWDTTSLGYRLPTEAEWEYACRGTSISDYSGTGSIDDMGWYNSNSGYHPNPIGLKKANSLGLYDMHGNVWEWCWDWYSDSYYKSAPVTNPIGPSKGIRRVCRGGSWLSGAIYLRSANRTFNENNYISCGIRTVRNSN